MRLPLRICGIKDLMTTTAWTGSISPITCLAQVEYIDKVDFYFKSNPMTLVIISSTCYS